MKKANKENNNPLPAFCDYQQLKTKHIANASHNAFFSSSTKSKVFLCKSTQ
jgi:hypothetical protein